VRSRAWPADPGADLIWPCGVSACRAFFFVCRDAEGRSRARFATFIALSAWAEDLSLAAFVHTFVHSLQERAMKALSTTSFSSPQLAENQAALSQGDERWAQRPQQWRERELALPWPKELLETFSLRMASHGMSISRALMLCDRRYALQQLAHAHNMADETLRLMAVQLFRHFEARQSGIPAVH
jgi:hypothetical protein